MCVWGGGVWSLLFSIFLFLFLFLPPFSVFLFLDDGLIYILKEPLDLKQQTYQPFRRITPKLFNLTGFWNSLSFNIVFPAKRKTKKKKKKGEVCVFLVFSCNAQCKFYSNNMHKHAPSICCCCCCCIVVLRPQ